VSFGAQQIITTAANSAYSVYATDIDGDGDQDVLSASSRDHTIAWHENRSTQPKWPQLNPDVRNGIQSKWEAREVELLVTILEGASSHDHLNEIWRLHKGRQGWRSARAAARGSVISTWRPPGGGK
jgi:hypothetical protein